MYSKFNLDPGELYQLAEQLFHTYYFLILSRGERTPAWPLATTLICQLARWGLSRKGILSTYVAKPLAIPYPALEYEAG